ncbi:MAG: hypothetical protein ACI4RT_02245 [Candidatus Spyradenecus sp.]
MSAFKEAVKQDVKSVFVNLDEFADRHALNGETVSCIVDEDLTEGANTTYEGVFLNTVKIYVATEDLPARPVEGELLYLDEEVYLVRKVSDEAGVLVITAEAHNQ